MARPRKRAGTPPVAPASSGLAQLEALLGYNLRRAGVTIARDFQRQVGRDLDAFFDDNSLTLATVPEPGSAWLLAPGLLALGWLRGRRRAG